MSTHNKLEPCGVVFAATLKPVYIDLAIRAAETLRECCPDLPIDLYTDRDVQAEVFSQIHRLEDHWFRPKIDALLHSRFERTLYIDSDVFVVSDLSDVFDVLDRFDLAAVQVQGLYSDHALREHEKPFPQSYPPFNGGLLAVKRSAATDQLLEDWKSGLKASGSSSDQPLLRELLWNSDLRLATLPPEYNIRHQQLIDVWTHKRAIPKVIHSPKFHSKQGKEGKILSLVEVLGLRRTQKLHNMLEQQKRDGIVSKEASKLLSRKHIYPGNKPYGRIKVILIKLKKAFS